MPRLTGLFRVGPETMEFPFFHDLVQVFEAFLNLMHGGIFPLHVGCSLHESLEELAPLGVLLLEATIRVLQLPILQTQRLL